MPSGTCASLDELPEPGRRVVAETRRAVLVTVLPDGSPHAVPVVFARRGEDLVHAVDAKPKSGKQLQRLRNIEADPRAMMLFDRYDEDWSKCAWVMVHGDARIEPPGSADDLLASRYEQYRAQPGGGEVIALTPRRITWWSYT